MSFVEIEGSLTESDERELLEKLAESDRSPRKEYTSPALLLAQACGPSNMLLSHRTVKNEVEEKTDLLVEARLIQLIETKGMETEQTTTKMDALRTTATEFGRLVIQGHRQRQTATELEEFPGIEILIRAIDNAPLIPEAKDGFLSILREKERNGSVDLTDEQLVEATNYVLEGTQLTVERALDVLDEMVLNGFIRNRDSDRIRKEVTTAAVNRMIVPSVLQRIIRANQEQPVKNF